MKDTQGKLISLSSLHNALTIESSDGTKQLASLDELTETIQDLSGQTLIVENALTSKMPGGNDPRLWYDLDSVSLIARE